MPPGDIDDLRLKRTLTRELERLLECGKARSVKELLTSVPPSWPGAEVASTPPQLIPPQEIYRSACRGVVAIGKLYRCGRCNQRHTGIASGFAIGAGLVVTNFHVVDDPDKETLGVMTFDGSVYPVESVLRTDRQNDLALLRVLTDDLLSLPVGDEPPVGAPIYVLSHPAGRLFTFTAGIVSRYSSHGIRRDDDQHAEESGAPAETASRIMTITADFGRGSSGAPVLDAHGAVVGVARQTKSVHHLPDDETPPRLQFVLKHCVPAGALWGLGSPWPGPRSAREALESNHPSG